MAAARSSARTGFSRKSTAPRFIASTLVPTSPKPVRKITGRWIPRSIITRCSSGPLIPGMRTSSRTHPGSPTRTRPGERKSSAEEKSSAFQPAAVTTRARPRAKLASSSTM